MKILLLNAFDTGGGAAQAAVRLVEALNQYHVNATLGVIDKKSLCPYVIEVPKKKTKSKFRFLKKLLSLVSKIFCKLFPFIKSKFITSNNILHSTNFKSVIDVNWINNSDYDLVNLHWINADMISIKDISKITKPIVWTMHDSWPCCGAEHHPNILENDTRYISGYKKENKPDSTKGKDICKKVWDLKLKYLSNKNITFIAPSLWENEVLKRSYLFKKCESFVIPNLINHSVFHMKGKSIIREIFNIPDNMNVIGFGAAYDIDNPNSMKGSYHLINAVSNLSNEKKYFAVVFGPAGTEFLSHINIPYFSTGYISNPIILSTIYNLCDVFVNPSLIENLPYTCLESICCGVPVTAFNVGGTSDIIEHKKNGYLATPYNDEELAFGIEYCLEHHEELSKYCIEKANKDFNTDETVKKYINVYKQVLKY
jgi:glycosyltransferase involved in cell wall biosynthesis